MKFDHAKLFELLQVFLVFFFHGHSLQQVILRHLQDTTTSVKKTPIVKPCCPAKAILIAQLQHNGVQSHAITCTFVFSPYHPDEKQKGRTQTGRPTQEVNIGLLECEFCLRKGARSKRGLRDPPLPARSFLRVMRSLAMCVNAASSAARLRT